MAVTDFDTEKLDQETQSKATERVNKVLHPAADKAPEPAPVASAAPAAAPTRKRRQRSDAGKPKTTPGMVVLKLEMPIAEASELLGFMLRTGKTAIAHALVDGIAKAQQQQA